MTTNSVSAQVGKPTRYHPALVTLHWLIAILMFSTVLLKPEEERGRFRPGNFPPPQSSQPGVASAPDNESQPGNFTPSAPAIDIHMILGAALLVLMIARLLVRLRTKHPEWASTGNIWLDRLGELTHLGLYVLTFGILIAGGYLAYQRGLVASVLGVGATAVTQGFRRGGAGFFIGALHGLSWNLLFLLLLLHVGAALYHQFILKDNLLGRMWYGKKNE